MKFAYADPPYIGCAKRLYGDPTYDNPEAHRALIQRMADEYDGWALSLHSPSLATILPMCPHGVRVMAWVKPMAFFKVGVNPAYAWEPVIVKPVRRPRNRSVPTTVDWVSTNCTTPQAVGYELGRDGGVPGRKPPAFCFWLFNAMMMQHEDEFDDLFPGSGAVTQAWLEWRARQRPDLYEAPGKQLRIRMDDHETRQT